GPEERRFEGLGAIRRLMEESRHPVAHHVTNVAVSVESGAVRLFFKVIGPGPAGRTGSADYRDVVRRTDDGWRIAEHQVTRRRPDPE
ncbi:MAG TPA: nuclear transport factor 2 family protein, partial [Acidimicrobiales bacterium]|nr:nuclear transport factor 2 family protein [Acidimicrobiales bacterium]